MVPSPTSPHPPPLFPRATWRHRRQAEAARAPVPQRYWSRPLPALLTALATTPGGLTDAEAARRLARDGANELEASRAPSRLRVLWAQLKSPLVLLLVVAAVISAFTGEWTDAVIVLAIVLCSVLLGYSREYKAQVTIARLRERVTTSVRALRSGRVATVPLSQVVAGDIVLLSAGSMVPADARVLEATDLFVSQAVLTGESFPMEKRPGVAAPDATLGERDNCVFRGTHVRNGAGRCVVVATGRDTSFGGIARRLTLRPPETEFDRGIRHFGYMLLTTMAVMVVGVIAVNGLLHRPPLESLLFALALAVGLSPELLPAILSVNLSAGSQSMAAKGVLVRRLSAIENLGSMDVLCTDKTGTLTEGVVSLAGAHAPDGGPSATVLDLAVLNATHQTGLSNPLDEALLRAGPPPAAQKLGEIPYDFVRKRLSVVVRQGTDVRLITKGAFAQVMEACTRGPGGMPLDAGLRARLQDRVDAWGQQGLRVLAVATRPIDVREQYTREDEQALTFEGFLSFMDRPKEGAREAIQELERQGVAIKLITGDSRQVAEHVARQVGLATSRVLTGRQLLRMRDEALWHQAEKAELFVEVDPTQKERILLALKKQGHVVGFLGDGVNDAPAMHAADASLCVEGAADVAREAADFVLLERHLDVVRRGIEEGRRMFANTLKYILTTTSANLGNMLSMAAATLLLPFLPLLAGQILLNNFLSDIPAVGLAGDSVDPELVDRPRRWSMRFLTRFMVTFGLLSAIFDAFTFGALLWLFHAGPERFRTGWFVESLLTELVVALVVRTRRPFYRSRPGTLLLVSTCAVVVLTLLLPFLPFARAFGLVPLPGALLLGIAVITGLYVAAVEAAKRVFYRRVPG
ncbi:magnesium-translocating P-type ATPase [Corallococcus sp. BB11-1]|uniref:magnesium-translocating P-type ATPase n=1 Tax=Corallococcus sp. BB11-1 TaxID=2996783 RepID=UPI0022714609|nr:magnesium-translocating P-type ATPase [Corallococcus sp. BB11-1]MCY1031187.1 magnesium-translocating P-type ATPase [Corallococcus sp. BB11-1]